MKILRSKKNSKKKLKESTTRFFNNKTFYKNVSLKSPKILTNC